MTKNKNKSGPATGSLLFTIITIIVGQEASFRKPLTL